MIIKFIQMDNFSDWLENQLRERVWSPADLTREAGWGSPSTVARILNGTRKPGAHVCRAIAKALGIPEEFVFRRAGLLSPLPATEDSKIREVWDVMKNMSPEKREEAINYIRYLYQQEQEAKRKEGGRKVKVVSRGSGA